MVKRVLHGLLCSLLLMPLGLFGQGERATITGTVTDATRSAISDANVILRNVETNVTTRTTTNSAGLYFITSIPPGYLRTDCRQDRVPYAEGSVYSAHNWPGGHPGHSARLGSVQQAVEVSATAVQLESQSSDLNTVVTTRAVSELPILGRDPLSFSALAPASFPPRDSRATQVVIGRVTTSSDWRRTCSAEWCSH